MHSKSLWPSGLILHILNAPQTRNAQPDAISKIFCSTHNSEDILHNLVVKQTVVREQLTDIVAVVEPLLHATTSTFMSDAP